MLRFSSVFPSLYSTLISSGAWVNLSEMMFFQIQAWSSSFGIFNQGRSVLWAEWEQGNARLLLVMPAINQALKTALTLLPLSTAVFCWGGQAGRSCWSLPQPGGACRNSRTAVQTPHTLPLHKPHVRTTTKTWPLAKGSYSFCLQPPKGWAQLFRNITVFACFPKIFSSNVSQVHVSSSFI